MPVGAAIGIASLSAGSSLLGAHMASNASKSAAQVQSQSADKALALERDIYTGSVARTKPFVDMGTTSMQRLMQKYWGTPFNDQVHSYADGGRAAGFGYALPNTLGGSVPPQAPTPAPAPSTPWGGAVANTAPGLAAAVQPAPQDPLPMTPAGGGGVLMTAPNGETSMVPSHLVQQFIAKGAQVVHPGSPARMAGTLGAIA